MKDRILKISTALSLVVLSLLAFQPEAQSAPNALAGRVDNTSIVEGTDDQVLKSNSERVSSGYLLLAKGNASAAILEFKKVLESDKHNVNALVGLGYSYGAQGEWGIARSEMEEAALYNPRNAFALVSYLDSTNHLGKLNAGILMVKRLHDTTDKTAAAPCWEVAQYVVEVDHWAAQWFAQKAHSLDPAAYPSAEVRQKPLKVHLGVLPPQNWDSQDSAVPGNYGNPLDSYYPNTQRQGAYGRSRGDNGGMFRNGGSYGNRSMYNLPYDGSEIPYGSYPLGNGLNYMPPYNGPLNR